MKKLLCAVLCSLAVTVVAPAVVQAQVTTYSENFTGTATRNSWYFFNGACLTAGSTSGATSPGQINSCASLTTGSGYYNLNYAVGEPLVGGTNGTIPGTDPTAGGALRFTNVPTNSALSYPSGYFESGAIVSNFTFPLSSQGIHVTFTTETYEGSGGTDGADGISFFLQDASPGITPDLGATGGSLAYSCSNQNNDPTLRPTGHPRGFDGLIGGYVGVGIDEYGNFMNQYDNTVSGYGKQYNRIGLRGAGNIAWTWLNTNYPTAYPSSLTDPQRAAAVQATCANGVVMNYSDPTSSAYGTQMMSTAGTVIPLADYNALAYSLLPTGTQIANEQAIYRGDGSVAQSGTQYGVPITYNLKITPLGLLTLSYSYDGGALQPVITGTNIILTNGKLPNAVRFGFAGSDGGSTNIHEVMCFQASPQTTAQSSVASTEKQSAEVDVGSQVYFAYYDPTTWAGSVTSLSLLVSGSTAVLASAANWDAACVLTGVALGATCAKTGVPGLTLPELPAVRTMLTYNGTSASPSGIPFEWATLPAAYQAALDTGDGSVTAYRLNYLRGDRTNEQNSAGTGVLTATGYRDRVSVLGDVVDSSPTWVGPPSAPYPATWVDSYVGSGASLPENNATSQKYSAFVTQEQSRINVVYAGANDGFLHGFRSGFYDASGNYVGSGSGASFVGTLNDGYEMIAYMPAYVLNNIQTTTASNDYSDPQYGHKFDVDATPATGEVFYAGGWHTWLVGGLGPGGAAMYALNITNPANLAVGTDPIFIEANAGSIVKGEWSTTTSTSNSGATTTTSTLSCAHTTASTNSAANCGLNLGNTYGTPQIRRFHNGLWGAVFGNGFGSSSGDGGIYVMVLNSSSGAPTFYYLSTGTAGKNNGIANVSAADLDSDHTTDYAYAGDLLGNVWRFDLTNVDPTKWAVTTYPGGSGALFSTGQPITTKLAILSVNLTGGNQRLLIEFGTGQETPQTNVAAAKYANAQQAIYGIWDWNLGSTAAADSGTWNYKSTTQYASLSQHPTGTAFPAPTRALAVSDLVMQQYSDVASAGVDYRTFQNSGTICWAGNTGCTTSGSENYGWYLNLDSGYSNGSDVNTLLPSSTTSPLIYEQLIYNPVLVGDALLVNTTIPPATSYTTCFAAVAGGYTMAINPSTGAAFPQTVFGNKNSTAYNYSGVGLSGTGTPLVVTTSGTSCAVNCNDFLVTQTVSGTPTVTQVNMPGNISGTRLTWIQRR